MRDSCGPRKMNVSSNIKRVQIACGERENPLYREHRTWAVIETNKNIKNYIKIDNNPNTLEYRVNFE